MNDNTLNIDKYGQLLITLKSYLKKDDIEFTEDRISVYDLYKLAEKRLQPLKDITNEHVLENAINAANSSMIELILKKKPKHCCVGVKVGNDGKVSTIEICMSKKGGPFTDYSIGIKKERKSDELYFVGKVDKNLVIENYDHIMNSFSVLEDAYYLFEQSFSSGMFEGKKSLDNFTDGFLDVKIECTTTGEVKLVPSINKHEDPDSVYSREWLKRQSLSDYVKENMSEILKKIPVNVSSLNGILGKIVQEELAKEKAPVLMKK